MATPTRKTSESSLNEFNAWMKDQPWYQQFMQSAGMWDRPANLSRGQQSQLESIMARNGVTVPSGMHIDDAGNLNQKNTLGKNVAIGAGIGAGALTGFGLAGMGPLSGLGGAGAAGAGAGAGLGAVPELGVGAIPGLLGPGVMETASMYPFLAGAPSAAQLLGNIPEGKVDDIPSLFGPGIKESAAAYPFLAGLGKDAAGNVLGDLGKKALDSASDVPSWLGPVMASLAGLPALLAKQGPSDEEKAYADQARRLLAQQEQRTQFQNPLYEAITKMAYGLQPTMGNGGNPYPLTSLSDVKVP